VLLLSLTLIRVLFVHLAERRLSLRVLTKRALLLSLEPGAAELRVERDGYGVKADVGLDEERIKVVIKFGLAKGHRSSKQYSTVQ
jgi:hypothetical protein